LKKKFQDAQLLALFLRLFYVTAHRIFIKTEMNEQSLQGQMQKIIQICLNYYK